MAFAKNIKTLRTSRGMSQEQLANALEVSRQAVSKWESGKSYPDMRNIIQICEMFDVDLDSLIKGDVSESASDHPEGKVPGEDSVSVEQPEPVVSEPTKDEGSDIEDYYDQHMRKRAAFLSYSLAAIVLACESIGALASAWGVPNSSVVAFNVLAGNHDRSRGVIFLLGALLLYVLTCVEEYEHLRFAREHPCVGGAYADGCYTVERRLMLKRMGIGLLLAASLLPLAVFLPYLIAGYLIYLPLAAVLASALFMFSYGLLMFERLNVARYNRFARLFSGCPLNAATYAALTLVFAVFWATGLALLLVELPFYWVALPVGYGLNVSLLWLLAKRCGRREPA